jgi:hypothetical protein
MLSVAYSYDDFGRLTKMMRANTAPEIQATQSADAPAPVFSRTFEFRLCGTEAQEQLEPCPVCRPADFIVATSRVTVDVTRTHDPTAASNAIGGVEARAALRSGAIVCTASLSDFGPGDLVVVRVEVALFRLRTGATET